MNTTKRLLLTRLFYMNGLLLLGVVLVGGAVQAVAQDGTRDSSEYPAVNSTESAAGYEATFPALGTLVSLKAFHSDKATIEQAFRQAEEKVHALESILTDYDPASETRRLSSDATDGAVPVSEPLWQVLVASDEWYGWTDGAFDSSLGALTRAWRKYRRTRRNPSQSEIADALAMTGWRHVQLDRAARTVHFKVEGLQLDFGAIGKGFIVDAAYQVLRDAGVACCLVNISGNMRCGNAPPGREGWRIEVSPLEKAGEPLRRIELSNVAIATSGDLWQYSIVDGSRRSHILDPKTGLGVLGPVAATVLAKTATDADALATAACIMEPESVLRLAERKDCEILLARFDEEHRIQLSLSGQFPDDMSNR